MKLKTSKNKGVLRQHMQGLRQEATQMHLWAEGSM